MFNLGAFLSYACIVTFTPGPNNIMSMSNASKHGFKKNLQFCFGVSSGFFVLLMLASFFNVFLEEVLPNVSSIMTVIGTAYMIYLALKIMEIKLPFGHKNKSSEDSDDGERNHEAISLRMGAMLQFLNPKAILYSLTIIPNFILPYYQSNTALIGFSLLLSLIALASTSSWALFGSFFNRFLEKYKKPVNACMGMLLVYSALTISGLLH